MDEYPPCDPLCGGDKHVPGCSQNQFMISSEGSESNVPAAPLMPKGTNYLTVQQNPNAPIYVAKGYSDENVNFNIVNRTKPNISFVIGMKRLTFKLNDDGLIDVEYDPEDFTTGALRVVEEVKRMLGVKNG